MKIILLIIIILFVLFFISFVILGFISRSGKPAGLVNGKLSKCPGKPNCICSEYEFVNDKLNYADPVFISEGITTEIISIFKSAIKGSGGTITSENTDYMAAVFSSQIFGFVDDLEIRFDYENNVIHMRSASRVGYSDMGVNRVRINSITKLFYNKLQAGKNSETSSGR